jgi:hypothetical protein
MVTCYESRVICYKSLVTCYNILGTGYNILVTSLELSVTCDKSFVTCDGLMVYVIIKILFNFDLQSENKMASRHLFPRKDTDFSTFLYTLILHLFNTNTPAVGTPPAGANAIRLGIASTMLDDIWALFCQWADIYARATNEVTSTAPLVKSKNTLRKNIEKKLREMYGDIPKSKLNANDRVATRMKQRDTTLTRVAQEDHAPGMLIEKVQHLQHTLRITDPAHPDSRAMPE